MSTKTILLIIKIAAIAIFIALCFRALTPEDSWICQNGAWIKHGNPSSPMPSSPCNK